MVSCEFDGTKLEKDEALTCFLQRSESIFCRRGSLWITQDGDAQDVVLGHGETFTAERDGRTVVSAFEGSELVIAARESHGVSSACAPKPPGNALRSEPWRRPMTAA